MSRINSRPKIAPEAELNDKNKGPKQAPVILNKFIFLSQIIGYNFQVIITYPEHTVMSKASDKDTIKKTAASKKKAATKKATSKKTASKKKAVTKKATTKKTASRKKTTARKNVSGHNISDRERYEMIATMAYYRAEKRNFAPGNELQDWYECEKIIDGMMKK
jgi:hypothetical protein